MQTTTRTKQTTIATKAATGDLSQKDVALSGPGSDDDLHNREEQKNKMSTKEYNGWTNKQTWNLNLMYQGIFESMAEEQKYDDVEAMADSFEALVEELEFDNLKENTLAHHAVGGYLDQVNWVEIAEHYFPDHVSERDSEWLQIIADSSN